MLKKKETFSKTSRTTTTTTKRNKNKQEHEKTKNLKKNIYNLLTTTTKKNHFNLNTYIIKVFMYVSMFI